MKRIALISNNIVKNIIVWDGITQLPIDSSIVQVDVTSQLSVSIGCTYDGTKFTDPPAVAIPLNKTYTGIQYGARLVAAFTSAVTQLGLTPEETIALTAKLVPTMALLKAGQLPVALGLLMSIPIDGVVVTQPLITELSSMITNYLTGATVSGISG